MREVLTLTPQQYIRANYAFTSLEGYLIGHLRHILHRLDDIDGTIHVWCETCTDDTTPSD